jgi:hypothetical protein
MQPGEDRRQANIIRLSVPYADLCNPSHRLRQNAAKSGRLRDSGMRGKGAPHLRFFEQAKYDEADGQPEPP